MYILPCVKWIASGKLLSKHKGSTPCSVTTKKGGMGWGVGGRSKRAGARIPLAESHCCVAETDSIVKQLSSN